MRRSGVQRDPRPRLQTGLPVPAQDLERPAQRPAVDDGGRDLVRRINDAVPSRRRVGVAVAGVPVVLEHSEAVVALAARPVEHHERPARLHPQPELRVMHLGGLDDHGVRGRRRLAAPARQRAGFPHRPRRHAERRQVPRVDYDSMPLDLVAVGVVTVALDQLVANAPLQLLHGYPDTARILQNDLRGLGPRGPPRPRALPHRHIGPEDGHLRFHYSTPLERRRIEEQHRGLPRFPARVARRRSVVPGHLEQRRVPDLFGLVAAPREARHHFAMHRVRARATEAVVGVVLEEGAPRGPQLGTPVAAATPSRERTQRLRVPLEQPLAGGVGLLEVQP